MEPFEFRADQTALDDLQERLARTRWPNDVSDPDWTFGTDPIYLRGLVEYWQNGFDWRTQEASLNHFHQFRTTIDGIGIHFVHERGVGPNPIPLVLTHGWPGTFHDFSKIVPLLTDPGSHGGDPADAFDIIVLSLPGYGFSDAPVESWFSRKIPTLWAALMEGLGYARFGAHGLDVGSSVCNRLAIEYPQRIAGIHVTYTGEPYLGAGAAPLTELERAFLAGRPGGQETGGGYAHIQRTKPVTLAYGLNDSPVGLAAWNIEKYRSWSDCDGDIESRFTRDELLTTVMIYWLSGTIGSSFRIYRDWALGAESNPAVWENREEIPRGIASKPLARNESIGVPAAVALFPADPPASMPREWAERVYADLRRFTLMPRGGHFPAMEEPELLAEDLREFFRPLRGAPDLVG